MDFSDLPVPRGSFIISSQDLAESEANQFVYEGGQLSADSNVEEEEIERNLELTYKQKKSYQF
ncbi:hypothetical protein MKX03_037907, partial [Papaver bracteatum]